MSAEVRFPAADGWELGALVHVPHPERGQMTVPGVVTVPGSRHEHDAWTQTAAALSTHKVATLLLDVRGRGASRGARPFTRMAPSQRRQVSLDVAAGLDRIAATGGVNPDRLAVVAEQDTAAEAVAAAVADPRVQAIVVVSPRHGDRLGAALAGWDGPLFGLVSKEDREGLRATVDAYLACPHPGSHIEVFRGLGVGITMASVRQFEQPDAERIEVLIARWIAEQLVGPASRRDE